MTTKAEAAATRRATAIDLRCQGFRILEIAQILEVHYSTVEKYLHQAVEQGDLPHQAVTPRRVTTLLTDVAPDNWRKRAACRDEDPELFFPIGTAGPAMLQTERAKQVCARCPVVGDCLKWALEHGVVDGVWGGMGEHERRALPQTMLRTRIPHSQEGK